jgi:hypothetical protein
MNETPTQTTLIKNPLVTSAIVLALSILVCTCIASYTVYVFRSMDNQLSVTGSAKQSITADRVKWTTSISRQTRAEDLKSGYDSVARDLKIVKQYFANNGFDESSLNVSTVYMDEVYENNNSQLPPSQKRYNLRQTIDLNSNDVQKVSNLSKNTGDVISQGVIFQTSAPEYSYSDLATLRVSLLAAALKDAKARAESIASMSGNSVGKLKSASSGVVQVLPPGSNEVSDYGTYDTVSIQKDVMVTVRASFNLK